MKRMIFGLLLVNTLIVASSAKVKEPQKIHGSSFGSYSKGGGLVDIDYTTQHVDKDEVCEVSVELIPKVDKIEMNVLVSLDKALLSLENFHKEQHFLIEKDQKEYRLHFLLSSKYSGVFYIRLFITIEDRIRTFAIPIYVGEYKKSFSKSLEKTKNGSNMIIYKAQETLR